ncbi:M20/M25/M40 family metallo-hydrolase [Parabacteroides sp. PF5-9]|uniref:M28 family metallopeptidase n=1 Tax=Parabacteroides sp. PF5-9 TaxID=1742404 RepID=UPI002476246D|nr:M20/M25/M40 family metallo-hydrolase [Parabacteroides sp. PF5-9]MDH6357875.1 hypothetical protein [Parabacteroides sp. PF5-9]
MHIIRIGIYLFFFFQMTLHAQTIQEKGLAVINQSTAESYIHFLAHDLLEGREAGTRGGALAREYIITCLRNLGIQPFNDSYIQPFEAYARERQTRGRFQVDIDSISIYKKIVHRKLSLSNILGKIEGKRAGEYVIVGAHYDHLGIDPTLENDQIYNGADDNASGVSAVLQLAKAFLATGQQPERTVIFAFWDGEEKGLLGSKYFVQSFSQINQVKAYLNFDMIGRNNKEEVPEQVVYFYTESHPVFGEWLKNDIVRYQLNLKPDYRPWDRPVGGSDNASFALLDIPVIWYHTDGHPDYHMPTDHIEQLNWNKLINITKASFLNLWNLANEKEF